MADLASSMSGFMFPEGFQPLDGCNEESDADAFMKSTFKQCRDNETEGNSSYKFTPSVTFSETLGMSSSLEVDHEVAVKMEPAQQDDPEDDPLTPTKPQVHLSCLSPLTPTANLKILISAASPDIRVLDSKRQKKALFNAMTNHASSLQELEVDGMQEEVVEVECMSQGEEAAEDPDKPINRKSKSLGLLCQRFLSRYPDYPENGVAMAISLDAISKDLGVERRRIYDIVNVLESIEMVSRVAKNKYLWHGKLNMESTLARLKCLGEKKRYADQIVHLKKLQIQNEFSDDLEPLSKQPFRDISNTATHNQDVDDKKEMDKFDEDMNNRRDKSLGVMSQKFIMLFLVSQAKVITLDIAARVLIGDINYEIREGSKFKTKVRRLYDIANILTSLEMIKKVHVQEGRGRKPAFRWIGPNPDTSQVDPSDVHIENSVPSRQSFFPTPAASLHTTAAPQDTKPSPTSHCKGSKKVAWSRHASFNAICEVVERERRSYSSAPNSPTKDNQDDGASDTPIDEKFRQDFEALRSKYPDQMSKIYVQEKQVSEGKEDATVPSRAGPSVAVPVSSPQCTPGNTAGFVPFNPKVIVSPLPGSLPVSNAQHTSASIALPGSFSVIKSGNLVTSSQGTIPNPGKASVTSSDGAKSTLVSSTTTTASSQYSLLTNTVNALHMVLRHPDTTRRSKRTIKQPVNGEFEYQPLVKRSKMEVEAASALQRSCQDLANQIQPGQAQFLRIPLDGKILQQPTGKPLQTIIIRRDVSVLNKNANSSLPGGASTARCEVSGPTQGAILTTLVPSGTLANGQQGIGAQQVITPIITHVTTAPAETPNPTNLKPGSGPNVLPQPPLTVQPKESPELMCMESLNDIEESTSNVQRPPLQETLQCVSQENGPSIQQASGSENMKQESDIKGLRFDKSKDMQGKRVMQRDTEATKPSITDGRSRQQQGQRPGQKPPTKIKKRHSVARALHLCPEFKYARVTEAVPKNEDSVDVDEISSRSVSAKMWCPPIEEELMNTDCGSRRQHSDGWSVMISSDTLGSKDSKIGQDRKVDNSVTGLERARTEMKCIDDEEALAWPLQDPPAELSRGTASAKTVPSQIKQSMGTASAKTVPSWIEQSRGPASAKTVPSQKEPALGSIQRVWPRPAWQSSKMSLSLPSSPFPSLDQSNNGSNQSPIPIGARPRSLTSLGVSEVDRLSGRSPISICSDKLAASPLHPCGFGDAWRYPLPRPLVMPYTSCPSPVQGRRLLSPFQNSHYSQSQAGNFKPHSCRLSNGMSNLSNSTVPLGCSSGFADSACFPCFDSQLQGSSPSQCQVYSLVTPFPPISAHHPVRLQSPISFQSPDRMSRVEMSPFTGSLFRPISRGGSFHRSLPSDRCLTTPVTSQSRDTRPLHPQTPTASHELRVSPFIGFPSAQSTPITGHKLLPHACTPAPTFRNELMGISTPSIFNDKN